MNYGISKLRPRVTRSACGRGNSFNFRQIKFIPTHKFGRFIIVIIQLHRIMRHSHRCEKKHVHKATPLLHARARTRITYTSFSPRATACTLTFMSARTSSSRIVAIPRRFVLHAPCRVQTRRCSPARERLWESKGTRTAGEWYLLKPREMLSHLPSFSRTCAFAFSPSSSPSLRPPSLFLGAEGARVVTSRCSA